MSEALLWPKQGGEPTVLLPLEERETELLGVSDLGGDGAIELMWSLGSEVWMTTSGSSSTIMSESHPDWGCGCLSYSVRQRCPGTSTQTSRVS